MDQYMYTIGYWNTRAIGEPIRLILEYCNCNFKDVRYHTGKPPSYDKSAWTDNKESLGLAFPNLPYLLVTNNEKEEVIRLTQAHSICRYLGDKFNILGDTVEERAFADSIIEAGRDWMNEFFKVTYCNAPWEKEQEEVHLEGSDQCLQTSHKFEVMKEHYINVTLPIYISRFEALLVQCTEERRYIAGTINPTTADLIIFEYIDQHFIFDEKCLPKVLLQYREQCLQLPFLQKYRASARFKGSPLHNRYSHFHVPVKNDKA